MVTLLAALVGLITGFVFAWAWAKSRHKPVYERSYLQGAEEVKREADAQLEAERTLAYREGRQEGRKEAAADLNVQVTPFYRKAPGDWNPLKKPVYDYGYRYQLFYDGKSCFDPAEVLMGHESEKDIDPGDLERRIRASLERTVHDGNRVKFFPIMHDEAAEMGVGRR